MRLIFIYGMPATGKLTVGRELASKTGYKLFHNHLVVDLLLSVFEFGSPEFIQLREEIWLSVIEAACRAAIPGLIFTFAPERTVSQTFVSEVQTIVTDQEASLDFVKLVCPLDQLKRRMGGATRSEFGKLTSVELFEQLLADKVFDTPAMPDALVTIDTSACSPSQAAHHIALALALAG